ncbi:nuclear transport factor 2 family protein [Sediminibacterium soli]|uniref:nuclear transport factor 2 family protein n=1 Tax=Sediminibacterium soli TaxID=2698829 RepID=UPI00137A710D|nr:nuclear transport factor 2 family protein [Sediminibacterium soli]NCI47369.1 nuclear transport factor 2 family protein [Sediminibacterium soli]
MKRLHLLALVMMVSVAAFSQTKEEKGVAASVDRLKKAMIDGQRAALENIASEKLSYGHSSGLVEDKAAFVEHIASGKSDFVSIDLSEQTISVAGNTAIVRHVFNAATNDNNTPGTVKLKILLVWHKEKGSWKLLARQAVKTT